MQFGEVPTTPVSTFTHTIYTLIHTCVDLQATALAVEQRGGGVFLQQRVCGSWGAVLLPERKADLWDKGLGSSETTTGMCVSLHWRRGCGGVLGCDRCVVLCFVFNLKNNLNDFHVLLKRWLIKYFPTNLLYN